MQILVNSNLTSDGTEDLTRYVESVVENAVGRFSDQITRAQVHLEDENGPKSGAADKRCMMEARLGGLKPIAVTAYGSTIREAIDGAAEKLQRALGSTLSRLRETPGRTPTEDEIVATTDLERLERDQARELERDQRK